MQHAITVHYSKLDELEPALFYADKMLAERGLYYQSPTQCLRDKGALADLSLKLGFFSTSLSLSREALSLAQE
jgi:hypothetical protein